MEQSFQLILWVSSQILSLCEAVGMGLQCWCPPSDPTPVLLAYSERRWKLALRCWGDGKSLGNASTIKATFNYVQLITVCWIKLLRCLWKQILAAWFCTFLPFTRPGKDISFPFFSASCQCQFPFQPKSRSAESADWEELFEKPVCLIPHRGLAWTWKWMSTSNLCIRAVSAGFIAALQKDDCIAVPQKVM